MENADGFGVGGLSPLRVGISPQVPGAQVFGVGCLRAPEPESQPQRGGRLNKGGGVRGGGEKEQESLKVMWLIEHQQPQIRLCPFVSFSQCVDGKVTRLKAREPWVGGASSGGRSLLNADPGLPQSQQGGNTVN